MKIIEDLRNLGWSEELIEAVGAIAETVNSASVDSPVRELDARSVQSSQCTDSTSIRLLPAALVMTTNNLTILSSLRR